MPLQDLYIGLGNLVYTIAKADGKRQPEEFETVEHILQQELYGEIALYSFQLSYAYDTSPEEAYQFALRRFKANSRDFDAETKRKFIAILQQVALCSDGICGKEKELLKRCQRDIERI